ncbi:unnamed protein product [Nezara viridula]|uniref:Uncharacterized protein n=1 Tax=Nezara viridula TaxID=85310 RepID=A0A9P0E7A7_NEZVI|nr:unnamed protein product [Nezara viridula]
MERKRARYKGPNTDWNNQEKLISKKTYIIVTNEEEVENSDREVQTFKKEDWQQSCIFDPAFTVDSSSSMSGESSSSNEWVNCDDDVDEVEEEKPQPPGISEEQNLKFVLTDFLPTKTNDEPPGNESTTNDQFPNTLPSNESIESIDLKSESENLNLTSQPLIPTGGSNRYASNPFVNKVQVYKGRMEPYYDTTLMAGNPKTLLSNISKFYIDEYRGLATLAGYISESETSVYSEDSTKRAIKSILKRGGKNQMGDNPKKKVRFDLNLRSLDDTSSDVSQYPLDKNAKPNDEKMEIEAKLTELNSHYKHSADTPKEQIVESNLEIYREQCNAQNYFTNRECLPKLKHDFKMNKSPVIVTQECKNIPYDLLAIEDLLEESNDPLMASSEFLNRKEIKNEFSEIQRKRSSEKIDTILNDSISFTSIGVQSDQLETDSRYGTPSKHNNMSRVLETESLNGSKLESSELKKTQTGSKPLISEADYSSFIKDLVNSSGDKLSKFLISLSSEISSKSGEEKIANALMTVGLFQEKNESHDTLKKMQKKNSNDNIKINERTVDSNYQKKYIGSVKNVRENGLNTNKKIERKIVNRRSMSEINIHDLKSRKPYYNHTERNVHSSRLDQLYIKETDDDCIWHSLPQNNPNINGEVMERLYEVMADLKKNVDKICRKESTIRIENAQIWLKENKLVEKNISSDGPMKAIVSEKTKETYSQTIETIGVHVGDHIQRQALGKTEILIVSNSKNEEINIKVNDKNIKNRFIVPSVESIEINKMNSDLNEIEERKRFFEDNEHIPFNVVFNERTHLPTLKKGKYEVEIFEKMDGQVIHDTNFKTFMKKLTGNLNAIKLNSLHSYEKPRNVVRSSRSSKSNSSPHSKTNKPVPNFITSFLNRLLKLRTNTPVKNSNRQFVSSQNWAQADRVNVLKSFIPESNKEKTINPINERFIGSNDFKSFKVGHTSSSRMECDREYMNMYEGEWPDVIKTRYPNGMIHFGPLTIMPEPTSVNYERQNVKSENCSSSKSGSCRRYVYNKHMKRMVKASMTRNEQQPEGELSTEFSETEQEFYHQWSQMGKV